MLAITLLSLLLIILNVLIHYVGLRGVAGLARRWDTNRYFVPPVLMFFMTLLHLVEILLYAGVYYGLRVFTDLGGFEGDFEPIFRNYLYFSGASYTTVGLSNFYPVDHFKMLTIVESLAGFMMLTWSATFFYSQAGKFLRD